MSLSLQNISIVFNFSDITQLTYFVLASLFVILAFLGFFRSVVTGVKPNFILDHKRVHDEWLTRGSFSAILLPIMGFFIFIFNAVAWAIYGVISIFEFLGFIGKAIWWAVMWMWNEFMHPVLFFIAKLLWHYIVVWSWRYFKLAITLIPEAFSASTFKNGFVSVLAVSFVMLVFLYLSSILQLPWLIIPLVLAILFSVLYFTLYTLFSDDKRTFNEFWTGTVMSKLGILVIISILSASIITVFHMFAGTAIQLPMLGLSYPVSLVLILVLTLTVVVSLVINAIAPAYTSQNNGEFDNKDFLINTGIRLPRLVGSIPFMLLGSLITSIITLIIGAFLWWTTNTIKASFCEQSLNKLNSELSMANSHFSAFYNVNSQANMALDFAEKRLKRMATIESRIYSLEIFEDDWLRLITNLPKGIRSTKGEKFTLERLEHNYSDQSVNVSEQIGELEKAISEITSKLRANPDNEEFAQQIDNLKDQLDNLKIYRGQLESKFILDTSLTQARIRSIKYTNIMWVIGTIFAMLGLVLLSAIVFAPYWVYQTKFYFDLYSYYHEGKSYIAEQVEYYQSRNINQPILGFFVLLIIGIIIAIASIIL
ncbi:hypothetical protein [Perlabentimonas gracilis]|uniref:hypothetical protein n=1 Tax=Perlabentimonas gracilis TaxID=2715279 RepID=UPI0014077C7D|nr:hypothetical protein [Perlabentimonas gracilis]NHB67350.1 hypothetical protein [Perlabentimonas gracilis]